MRREIIRAGRAKVASHRPSASRRIALRGAMGGPMKLCWSRIATPVATAPRIPMVLSVIEFARKGPLTVGFTRRADLARAQVVTGRLSVIPPDDIREPPKPLVWEDCA